MKLLLVSVGEGRYAVAAEAVAQIMDPALDPKFHREPGAGELIYHGGRCPVVDLNGTAGDEEGGASLFLVLEGSCTFDGQPMSKWDLTVVEADQPYGFVAGPDGLHFLVVRGAVAGFTEVAT